MFIKGADAPLNPFCSSFFSKSLVVEDEFGAAELETEPPAGGGFLEDLSPGLRVIIMVVAAAILYLIVRELYMVLIGREWHPANAKLLTFSSFFALLCAVFTVLYINQLISNLIIVAIWVVLAVFVVLAILKRRR